MSQQQRIPASVRLERDKGGGLGRPNISVAGDVSPLSIGGLNKKSKDLRAGERSCLLTARKMKLGVELDFLAHWVQGPLIRHAVRPFCTQGIASNHCRSLEWPVIAASNAFCAFLDIPKSTPLRRKHMSREVVRPFLVNKDEEGFFRLTVRDTRYNSQGYPLVTATLQEEKFKTATAAKAFAREHFGAETGQYATK